MATLGAFKIEFKDPFCSFRAIRIEPTKRGFTNGQQQRAGASKNKNEAIVQQQREWYRLSRRGVVEFHIAVPVSMLLAENH
jgi:hypothetical protein